MKESVKTIDLSKSYIIDGNTINVLNKINFTANKNEITVIVGKSGCGKTTFLRLLSSLEKPDEGKIILEEQNKISFVFQEPRLMPWTNVYGNITFGMNKKNIDKENIVNLIKLVGLNDFEHAYPHELSLGMQERVSIARAFANDGSIILMDEPFASLDYFTRENMQNQIIKIHEKEGKSIIFVTHSLDEAIIIGQKIVVFEGGSIKKEYNISKEKYPRNIMSDYFIDIKKDILKNIKQNEI